MTYKEMIEMLNELKNSGGFPSAESLDSLARIAGSKSINSIPANEVISYAWALADIGEGQRAEAVARLIEDREEQEETLAEVAQRLASNGFLDKAGEIVFSIPIDAAHPSALTERIF